MHDLLRRRHDDRGFAPQQYRIAAGHSLRPLRHIAQHQARQAQRRRLFLHPAGIGQDQHHTAHQRHEGGIAERRQQMHARPPAEGALHRA